MVRRKAKWKKPEPKVLATPESKRVLRCYAQQGRAYIFHPAGEGRCTLVLIDSRREVVYVERDDRIAGGWYNSNEVPLGDWRVLGWIPREGRLPHGELEEVDPELADWEKLPVPNREPPRTHSSRPNLVIDIVPWDADGKPEYDW